MDPRHTIHARIVMLEYRGVGVYRSVHSFSNHRFHDLDSESRHRPPVDDLIQDYIELPDLLQSSQNTHRIQIHKQHCRPHGPPEARLWQRKSEQVLKDTASPPIETMFSGSNVNSVKAAQLQRVCDAFTSGVPVLAVPHL